MAANSPRTQATRLLWRAGFGPRPGDAERLARLGMDAAVASLTRPAGAARLIGAAPHDDHGEPLDPINTWGDDHCWWLDRMVRSDQQLVERMTLIWHSWFATSEEASNARLMIKQNWMMRRNALGNFHQLLLDVTVDPAMLLWLNGNTNNKDSPNENYGREMLELFTLGADRGYDQDDVHQNSRALTGWTNDWSEEQGPINFRFEPEPPRLRDQADLRPSRTVQLARQLPTGGHPPRHPSFLVSKMWGYFVGARSPARDARARSSGRTSAAVTRSGPSSRRSSATPCSTKGRGWSRRRWCGRPGCCGPAARRSRPPSWTWVAGLTGQVLFQPPNVSGWNYAQWLDTSRWAGRLEAVDVALQNHTLSGKTYPFGMTENAREAYQHAIEFWGGRAAVRNGHSTT